MVMNVILFIIGFLLIGGNFGAKTLYASFGLSGSMWFIEKVMQAVDALVVILGGITFGLATALYAIVCVALNGIIIDKVIEGQGGFTGTSIW